MKTTHLLLASLGLALGATAQSHWYVATTGNDANAGTSAAPFLTINHAAAVAAANDVIHIAAGTYGDEQGSILLGTKNLSLVGAGRGVTVLRAHSSANLMLPIGTLASPTLDVHRNVLTLQGTATTWLRGVTLDNNFSVPSSGRMSALWIGGGADAVLDDVECTNTRANPINGIQGPVGVLARGDGVGDTTNLTMRNCLVHEYGKNGVTVNYDVFLTMDECHVDGFGHAYLGLAAQNGVQVSRGASCDVRRTAITDHWYDPSTVVATDVLIFDPGATIVFEENDIANGQVGMYWFATAAMSAPGVVRRNRFANCEYGFYDDNVSGLLVTGNSFAVSQALDNDDAWDDAGGNTWSGNTYASLTTAGAYTLPGLGGDTDATAQPFLTGFGARLATNLPGGYAPLDLAVTDLDGDGDSDFAAVCQTATTPALAIGLNGGGTFAVAGLTFGNAAGSPVQVVSGEFNGAPGRDLAVVTVSVPPVLTENKVYVFANNGLGGFSLLTTVSVPGATSASGIAAGDVDGDGRADLVVTDAGAAGLTPGSARLLRNNGTGTGFAVSALADGYTAACRGAAIGDFTGDGKADVAITEGRNGLGRLHRFVGDGVGGFTAAPVLTVSNNTNRVLATDVEGDGDIDLLVTSTVDDFGFLPGAVDVLTNLGGGTFAQGLTVVDRGPTAIAAGDFGNDADPDTQRRDVAVLNFAGSSISVLGTWSAYGQTSGGIAVSNVLVGGIGIGDVDGDGLSDLLYADIVSGTVVTVLGDPLARADTYGAGTTGTSAKVPNLYPVGVPAVPTLGNASFGFGLRNARPLSLAVVAAGFSPAPVLPASILIGSIDATWAVVTNVFGTSAVPLPIPSTPALAGLALYSQGGVFDPNGDEVSFFPGFALTNGLKLRLGH